MNKSDASSAAKLEAIMFAQIETVQCMQSRNEDCPETVMHAAEIITELAIALTPLVL